MCPKSFGIVVGWTEVEYVKNNLAWAIWKKKLDELMGLPIFNCFSVLAQVI